MASGPYGNQPYNAPYNPGYAPAPANAPPPPYPGDTQSGYGYTQDGMPQGQPMAPPMIPPMMPRIPLQGNDQGAYYDGPKPDDEETGNRSYGGDDAWGNTFSDKAIRRAFIRKVYLILTAQLLVTVVFICFFLFHKPTQKWVQQNSWFYWTSYGVFFVTYITLVCCPSVRRKFPSNFICLAVFTLCFSYMTGTITSFYDTEIVLIAAGITAAVCLGISIFAMQTKIDFTLCTGLLVAGSLVLFFFGIACVIVYAVSGPNYILHCVYGALAALLFSLFLAYDTQMILGGRKHQISEEDYIFAALQLYLDIVYLFLIILSFFGGKGNN